MAAPITPLQLRTADLPGVGSPTTLQVLNQFFRQSQVLSNNGITLSENANASIVTSAVTTKGAWTLISAFANGWSAFSTALTPQWTKLASGLVVVRGAVHSGTINTTAFTLPQVTDIELQFAVPTQAAVNNTSAKLVIAAGTGNVAPTSGTDVSFFACAFSFLPADPTPVANLASALSFRHGLSGACTDLLVTHVTDPKGVAIRTSAVMPVWADNGDGSVTVTSLPGLTPNTAYTVRFLCMGNP